jgi:hypothetical protein
MLKLRKGPLAGAVLFFLVLLPCAGDELAEKGRAVFNKYQHVVAKVSLAITTRRSISGLSPQTNEVRQIVSGTVVTPSGITAVPLAQIDAEELAQMAPRDPRMKLEFEVSDIRMTIQGTEDVPAEVVQREKEVGFAFVRPKAKLAAPAAWLDLSQAGSAEILDPVIALNRLSPVAGRAYSASVERIAGIVREPHLFYIPDSNVSTATLGSPAITLDGKALGIFTLRASRSPSGPGPQGENFAGVIIPAKDILDAAKRIPQ